jgi:NAD+ diphosphatase
MAAISSIDATDLDRAAGLRADREWVRSALDHPGALALVHVEGDPLLDDRLRPATLPLHAVQRCAQRQEPVLLGLDRTRVPQYAVDLSRCPEALRGHFRPMSLHGVTPSLQRRDAARLAYARALLLFHRDGGFCSACGAPTEIAAVGAARRCTGHGCGREIFPPLHPAVIMVIELGPTADRPRRCLLARHAGSKTGAYSTLAGFVEPGETLEEAVAREAFEEAGVTVESAEYVCSVPWPFPAQIMVGFVAVARDENVRVDGVELVDGRWFSAAEVAALARTPGRLPRRGTISADLVQAWRRRAARLDD